MVVVLTTNREERVAPGTVLSTERGDLREFCEDHLLKRDFRGLRDKNNQGYFNKLYGRIDLVSPKSLLD